ncbi:MAG: carbon-nitrogen hydrolase family protein [Nanoarchaeota archaeon]
MKKIKIAMIQTNPENKNGIQNSVKILKKLQGNVDIAVFPEYFLGWDSEKSEVIIEAFKKEAKETGMNIVLGSIVERVNKKLYNTCFILNDKGKIVGFHRKVHLFPDWENWLTEGDDFKVYDLNGLKIGIAICLDVYFPQDIRKMANKGADVLIVPTLTSKDEFEEHSCVMRTRAMENVFPVLLVNGVGSKKIGNKLETWAGNSMLINPYGNIVSRMNDKEGINIIEIDPNEKNKAREELPFIFSEKS